MPHKLYIECNEVLKIGSKTGRFEVRPDKNSSHVLIIAGDTQIELNDKSKNMCSVTNNIIDLHKNGKHAVVEIIDEVSAEKEKDPILEIGDLVHIQAKLPRFMNHFSKDKDAIIIGCSGPGLRGHEFDCEYVLYIQGEGHTSWYHRSTLDLLKKNQRNLLKIWQIQEDTGV